MRVKRYIVDTMPEAMQHIRNDLGGEAVILSSKEVKIGGFMGMFSKKKIEVIAAVEKEEKPKNPPSAMPAAPVPRSSVPQAYKKTAESSKPPESREPGTGGERAVKEQESGKTTEREQAASDFAAAFAQAAAAESSKTATGAERMIVPDPVLDQPLVKEEKAGYSTTPAETAFSSSPARMASEQKMLEELREMKEWIARLSRQNFQKRELPAPLDSIRERLIRQDVSPHLADRWLFAAVDEWIAAGMSWSDEQIQASFAKQVESFLEGRFGGGLQAETRIVYIAGPTGVGKTTTIAKMAAEQLFKYRRKVGFITSDTYRISAVDQLRTYASILNVPLEVVQSPGDMQRAMQRLEACDLILMDTAGRNYRNELLVSELQSLLLPRDRSETYLVLSLTSKSSDMIEITEHFSKFGLDKVIFTKLDETGSYGPMFDLLDAHPLMLSYMTNGQNVPDDLLMPDSGMLTDLLIGESRL